MEALRFPFALLGRCVHETHLGRRRHYGRHNVCDSGAWHLLQSSLAPSTTWLTMTSVLLVLNPQGKSRPRMRSGDGEGRRERLAERSPFPAGLAQVPFTVSPSLAWFMATASHLASFRPPGFWSFLHLPPEGSS